MVTGIVSNSGKRYGTPFRINAGDDNFYDILHSSSFPFSCFFFLLCSCRPLGCTAGTELPTGERGAGNPAWRRTLYGCAVFTDAPAPRDADAEIENCPPISTPRRTLG